MQKSTIKGLAVSALFLGMLAAVQTASAAPQGIRNTRHNLGSGTLAVGASTGTRDSMGVANGGGLGDVFTTGTSEVCVFCHTPHGANTAVPVPLWNKGSLTNTVYQTFNSGTMNSAAPANLAGHMSLACLSCHDGTQAMDNMVNQPGQGGYNAQGVRLGIDAKTGAGSAGTWYAGNNNITAGDGPDNQTGNADVSAGKLQPTAGVDFIGTDLSNDHPIGMSYGGGNCTVNVGGSCADVDFNAAKAGLNGWFEVGGAAAGSKTNMRLYGQTLASATVECASCHDPHSDAQATFLRVSNAGSGVCLTCHAK